MPMISGHAYNLVKEFDREINDVIEYLMEEFGDYNSFKNLISFTNPFVEEIPEELEDHPVIKIRNTFLDRLLVRKNHIQAIKILSKDLLYRIPTFSGGSAVLYFVALCKAVMRLVSPHTKDKTELTNNYELEVASWVCDAIEREGRLYAYDIGQTIEKSVIYPLRFYTIAVINDICGGFFNEDDCFE
jgi:hypothetical protein